MKRSWRSAVLACVVICFQAYQQILSFSGGDLGSDIQDVTVLVRVNRSIATVSENFVCATIDWWPPQKCNYGSCSWGHSSLLNLDLTNPILQNAVKGLSPVLLRLGGSLQDQVIYDVGDINRPCHPFVPDSSYFGFSEGCLNMSRWKALNEFFHETGSQVAFGLNALHGKEGDPSQPWDPSNSKDFMQFTIDHGYPIYAWELGNELNGVGVALSASQYAAATKELRILVDDIYSGSAEKPLVIAPDGFFDPSWYREFLQETGPQVLDACTYHIYNLGSGSTTNDIKAEILSPAFHDKGEWIFYYVNQTLKTYGPLVQAWVGESGGAYNGGQRLVSNSFLSSFWYVDQLGLAASYNTQVYCRQTLIGGNYGLLNVTTFKPNPDYYSALLWKELMGTHVLAVEMIQSSFLRAFAHCSKGDTHSLSVVLINLSNSTQSRVHFPLYNSSDTEGKAQPPGAAQSPGFRLSFFGDLFSQRPRRPDAIEFQNKRLEYHLTAADQDLESQTVLLNGNVLQITPSGNLPALTPIAVDKSQPVIVAPTSIVFVRFPDVSAPACQRVQERVSRKN